MCYHSVSGGAGGGLTARIADYWETQISGKTQLASFLLFPSEGCKMTPLETFNSVLFTTILTGKFGVNFMIDNA